MQHFFALITFLFSAFGATAQTSSDVSQQLFEQVRALQIQNESVLKRMEMEESLRRLEQERERIEAERDRQNAEMLEQQEAAEALVAKAIRVSEEAADDQRRELLLQEVKAINRIYALFVIFVICLIGYLAVRGSLKDGGMRRYQKFGILVMSISLFLFILTLTLSDGWVAQIDLFQNIMSTLRIAYFPEYESAIAPRRIDFSAKYLLVVLFGGFLYGFLVFVGVFPGWDKSSERADTRNN